ncbi:MAG: hypothetical protein ABS95_02050 [Verrucomicrobia bacterium SCN 57-15]|nr:MAG: hypothetical protein ABS95_02050 [Verrucomicrobia bacterium SCN 57-15]
MLERELIIGFFIVRRLIEMHKLSSQTRDLALTIFACPARGRIVNRMNACDIDDLYDLERETRMTKKPLYLSNQFIHSYISFIARDETGNFSDVLIVSDFDRKHCIWRIPVPEIRKLFLTAVRDYPHSLQYTFDADKGDYNITTNQNGTTHHSLGSTGSLSRARRPKMHS